MRHRFLPDGDSHHTEVDRRCYELAVLINDTIGDSRLKSLAITALEQTQFWVSKGV
ncbi:MAG: DUF7681 family protein [Pseudonocardiaceae bacterium]